MCMNVFVYDPIQSHMNPHSTIWARGKHLKNGNMLDDIVYISSYYRYVDGGAMGLKERPSNGTVINTRHLDAERPR